MFMTNIHDSIAEVDRTLSRVHRHFLYTESLAERVMDALNNDALAHSNKLEPDSDNMRTYQRLQQAWEHSVRNFRGVFDNNFVLDIATIVHPKNEHRYRDCGARIQGRRSQTPYILTNPIKIDREMTALFDYVKTSQDHSLQKAAALHLYFVLIHPLTDGNGRTSRLIQNAYLFHHKYPPALIRSSDRQTYINHVEDALLGYRDRIAEGGSPFACYSFAEYRFFEYMIEQVHGSVQTLAEKILSQKMYLITLDIRGSSRKGVNGVKCALQRGFKAHGVIGTIQGNYDAETITVVAPVSRENLLGNIEAFRERAPYIKSYRVTCIH